MKLASENEHGLGDKMDDMAKADYDELVSHGHLRMINSREVESFETYRHRYYWHIHEVELI